MSVAQQAMAARRKARVDVRYIGQSRRDVSKRDARQQRMIEAEKARQMRKKKV